MTLKLAATAVALAVAAVLAAACAGREPVVDDAPAPGASAVAAPVHRPSAGKVFFDELRPGEAVTLKRQPMSLTEAYAETTAVVEAVVVDVRPGRTIGEPAMESVLVDLRPARTLRGVLQPELPGVTVEFGVFWDPGQAAAVARRMKSDLPNRGIWLLRWQGKPSDQRKPGAPPLSATEDVTLYRTIHPNCGVFVQGKTRVEAPSSQDTGRTVGAQAEAERFATLAELAAHAVRA